MGENPEASSETAVPCAHASGAADRSPASAPPTAIASERWRVLVIDDEPAIGRLIRNLLAHHDIHVVSSGESGLARLRDDDAFDVVVCDVMMPEVSGMDVYNRIAVERPGLERRFVFVTGGTFTERATSFLASIPSRRVDKPFAIAALESAMEETIRETRRPPPR